MTRGRSSRASTMATGRQYATSVAGHVIHFECARKGHMYKIDYSKKPHTQRLGTMACRMMASWWSREKGGCIGECPKCRKEQPPR